MNAMTMRVVRGADGTTRHVPALMVVATGKRPAKARPVPDPITTNGDSAAEELRLLIERAERIAEEVKGAQDDLKDVFAEAKGRGYDARALKQIMAIRKKNKEQHQEEEAILETYQQALGMI